VQPAVTWYDNPHANWMDARAFCVSQGATLATAEQVCPGHPGGQPSSPAALSGDHWVAFAGDPNGVDNAWMQVGDGRPTLTCYSHHSGQDGHSSPPSWGTDAASHSWMGWIVCATGGSAGAPPGVSRCEASAFESSLTGTAECECKRPAVVLDSGWTHRATNEAINCTSCDLHNLHFDRFAEREQYAISGYELSSAAVGVISAQTGTVAVSSTQAMCISLHSGA